MGVIGAECDAELVVTAMIASAGIGAFLGINGEMPRRSG